MAHRSCLFDYGLLYPPPYSDIFYFNEQSVQAEYALKKETMKMLKHEGAIIIITWYAVQQ